LVMVDLVEYDGDNDGEDVNNDNSDKFYHFFLSEEEFPK
jgi:hypothetical protein